MKLDILTNASMTEILKKFKFTPYNQFIIFLSVMAVSVTSLNLFALPTLVLNLVVAFGFYFLMKKFYPTKKKMLPSILATTLIIYLVWHPAQDLNGYLISAFIVLVALSLKYFGQVKAMSLFNPAALAMVIGALIVRLPQFQTFSFISWWGAAFGGAFSLILVGLWIVFGLKKWGKHYMTLAFLIFYFIFGFIENPDIASYNLTNSTIYFLAAVMLIDPKSSPTKKTDQIFYGIFAAGMLWLLKDAELYASLLAILATNLAYFIRTKVKFTSKPKTAQ